MSNQAGTSLIPVFHHRRSADTSSTVCVRSGNHLDHRSSTAQNASLLLFNNPLASAHERLGPAVLCNTIHIHLIGADHPVDMDQALVGSAGGKLLLAHGAAAPDALAVGLAQRDVARGVLVEEGVEEEQPALRDR